MQLDSNGSRYLSLHITLKFEGASRAVQGLEMFRFGYSYLSETYSSVVA